MLSAAPIFYLTTNPAPNEMKAAGLIIANQELAFHDE